MKYSSSKIFAVSLLTLCCGSLLTGAAPLLSAQTAFPTPISVPTRSYNNQRTGANPAETLLSTANVNTNQFGMLFSRPVDGEVYAQPLYLPNLIINGAKHNVLFVATMHDTLYAFDADDPTASAPLWKTSYLTTMDGVNAPPVTTLPVPTSDVGWNCGKYNDIAREIGILSTPVIDAATGTLYLVTRTKETGGPAGTYVQRLHAVNIYTGLDRMPPTVIAATYPTSAGGTVTFDSLIQNQRSALLLDHGSIVIAWASHCDTGSYHGWVMSYGVRDSSNNPIVPTLKNVFCSTPDGSQGGIWQSGQGVSADAAGNLYFAVGNGDNSIKSGGTGYGNALVKLTPNDYSPYYTVADWFMPYNTTSLNNADLDSACGVTLVPSSTGAPLAIMGGKDGVCYVCDSSNLGKFNPNNAGSPQNDYQIVGTFTAASRHLHGSAAYYLGPTGTFMYLWGEYSALRAFPFNGTTFASTPATQTLYNAPNGMPGGTMTISSNGIAAGTGIVWANLPWNGDANQAVVPGVLRAFDATDMTKELWNSHQSVARDDFGNYAKYCPPVVTNGKVYMATFSNQVVAYGILPAPLAPSTLSATGGNTAIALSWTAGTYATSYNVKRSLTANGTFATVATGVTTAYYLDTGLTNGTKYYYKVSGVNANGESADSNVAFAVPTPGATGTGNGLLGKYYTGAATDFSAQNGTPVVTATDATINFNRSNSGVGFSPRSWDSGVPRTVFTAVWTGQIQPPVSGLYTLYTVSDDGVRLSLDTGSGMTVLISNPTIHGPTLDTGPVIPLLGGHRYNIKMEYFQNAGGYTAQLLWSSSTLAQQIIPQAQLFSQSIAVSGRVALEGVSDLTKISAAAMLGSFTLEFRTPGTTSAVYIVPVTVSPVGAGSPYGTYSTGGVAAGTYDVTLKGSKNLRVSLGTVTVSGAVSLPDAALPAGDADDSNSIDIADFGILVNAFSGSASVPLSGYDSRADFDYNGIVDIGDFGLLVNEYGNSGTM